MGCSCTRSLAPAKRQTRYGLNRIPRRLSHRAPAEHGDRMHDSSPNSSKVKPLFQAKYQILPGRRPHNLSDEWLKTRIEPFVTHLRALQGAAYE